MSSIFSVVFIHLWDRQQLTGLHVISDTMSYYYSANIKLFCNNLKFPLTYGSAKAGLGTV